MSNRPERRVQFAKLLLECPINDPFPDIAAVPDVPFPDELIGSRAIIYGTSGAGKTYAIRRILEARHGRMRKTRLDSRRTRDLISGCFALAEVMTLARRPSVCLPPLFTRLLSA